MMMRLFVEHYLSKVATLPSPGIDELRWVRPVRAGDRLRVRVTVTERGGRGASLTAASCAAWSRC